MQSTTDPQKNNNNNNQKKKKSHFDDLGWNYEIEKDGPKNEVKKEDIFAIDLWFLGKTISKNNIL